MEGQSKPTVLLDSLKIVLIYRISQELNLLIISDYYILGDLISEEKGKITTQRVLEVEGGEPKMETSFSATGNYRGVETTATVTYLGSLRPGGAIYGEGQGVLMSKDG